MKKSENPAKLSKGCKKGLKHVSSSQNIQCKTCFFFQKDISKDKQKLVGWGEVG
jgi:hypothetical protein